jgi:hypothetical protein
MDLNFDCPRCGQNISIDEKGAGATVECPTCKGQISVPSRRIPQPPPFIPSVPVKPGSVSAGSLEPIITRRSGWALFLKIVGGICLVGGVLGFLSAMTSGRGADPGAGFISLIIGIGGAIQAFFFAFLIDVFTDIRWYLKKLVDAGRT